MRTKDIAIRKVFLCLFDASSEVVPYSEHVLGAEDELYRYVVQLLTKYFYHDTSRRAYIDQESELLQILPEDPEQMEAFVNCICDQIQDLMRENAEIQSGAGIFVWAAMDEQEYIAFFKSGYQSRFCAVQNEAGVVGWQLNPLILPGPSPKATEYFYINLNENQAQVSDYECHIQGIMMNYLAEYILKLSFKPSEAVTVKAIDQSVVETIKHCYEEQAPKKIIEYKTAVADQVEEKGQIDVSELEETIFKDNAEAAAIYQEVSVQQEIPRTPVYVSKKTERRLTKKQKLVTDSGIEILVPLELLRDDSVFEYHHNDDGKISILIKEIASIENK